MPFPTTVLTFLFLAALVDVAVSSLTFPFSIPGSSLSLGGPPGHNYTSFDELPELGLTWDIIDADGLPVNFVWTTADATVELMSGTAAQALTASVLSPLSIGLPGDTSHFDIPTDLPDGAYHLRVTSLMNTTIGSQITLQTLTTSGADLHWTRPSTGVGCGPNLQPPPFIPIKDISDPRFTSFAFSAPYAGQNYPLSASIMVGWQFRIWANWGGEGISAAELQVLNATSGDPVLNNSIPVNQQTLAGFLSFWLNPVELGLQANTQYQLQLKYINAVQDGPVPPGMIVTHVGDVFNVVPTDVDCDAQNKLVGVAPVVSSLSTVLPSSQAVHSSSSSSNHASSTLTVAHSPSVISSQTSASSAVTASSPASIPSTTSTQLQSTSAAVPASTTASSRPISSTVSTNAQVSSASILTSSAPASSSVASPALSSASAISSIAQSALTSSSDSASAVAASRTSSSSPSSSRASSTAISSAGTASGSAASTSTSGSASESSPNGSSHTSRPSSSSGSKAHDAEPGSKQCKKKTKVGLEGHKNSKGQKSRLPHGHGHGHEHEL